MIGRDQIRRRHELEALWQRIEDEHARNHLRSEVWFWPERDGVKGFLGTDPIIVAGLNPSMGRRRRGPSETDTFFYNCIREEGLADVHITDVVKVRSKRRDVPLLVYDPTILQLHRDYFAEEVKIIKPAVVIVMGDEVLRVLCGWQFAALKGWQRFAFEMPGEEKAAMVLTVHPAATRWPKKTAERRARFRKDVQEARRMLDSFLQHRK